MVVQLDSHCCFSCSSCAVSNLYYVFNLFTLSLLKLAATVGLVTVCRWVFFLPDSFYVKVYTYQIEKAWVDLSSQKLPLHIGELTENCRPTLCYFKHQCFTSKNSSNNTGASLPAQPYKQSWQLAGEHSFAYSC